MTTHSNVDIVKGILGSQILSVPISCALSSTSVLLACRFISKTSTSRPAQRRYFEYQAGSSRPTRMILARAGAVLVAVVCILMTLMELSIIYQTAITHPADAEFKEVVPWTSSFVPLLTAITSIATQTYFSDKILHQVQSPKAFLPFLLILSLGSLSLGAAATIALLIKPFKGPTVKGIPISEGLFWSYLIMTTISSVVIAFILVGSFLRERRANNMIARRSGDMDHGPTMMNFILRFFLSTYTLVFILNITCLITVVVSASPIFETAFNASVAFLVLQKMMVRVMAVSYLYALLDGIPQNPIFVPPNDSHLKALYVTPSSEQGFTAPKSQNEPEKFTKSKLKTLHSSVNRALSNYENVKNNQNSSQEDEGEIFNYSYPPHSASSMVPYNRTPATSSFPYDSVSNNLSLEKGPKSSRRSHYNLTPGPNLKSYQMTNHQSPFLPSLPPIPPQFRETQPLPALPKHS